jgi:uncharacterized protein
VPDLNLNDPHLAAILTVVALFAGFVRGFTGFGGPAVMVLAMVPFFSPLSVVTKVVVIDLVANVKMMPSTSHEIDVPVVVAITLGSLLGAPLGLYLLEVVDPVLMKRVTAVVAMTCTIAMMTGWRFKRMPSTATFALAGAAAGIILGATLIAFLMMVFLFASPASAAVSRANAVMWGFVMTGGLISAWLIIGSLDWPQFWRSIAIGVIYLLGSTVGAAAFRRTSEHNFRKVVLWFMLTLASAGLLV